MDLADRDFLSLLNRKEEYISDLLFLSKHVAASGKPSLTIHPIGIPWQLENSRSGGIPGKCSPPNYRMASLYRQLMATSSSSSSSSSSLNNFEITLEATHHGPYCDKPSCFLEIGSSENEWNIKEFGDIWAETIEAHFALDKSSSEIKPSSPSNEDNNEAGIAVVVIGGGHYVPKMNDLVMNYRLF